MISSITYASAFAGLLARKGVAVTGFIPDALEGAKGYQGRAALRYVRTYLTARAARETAYWANRYATEAAELELQLNPPRFISPALQVAPAA